VLAIPWWWEHGGLHRAVSQGFDRALIRADHDISVRLPDQPKGWQLAALRRAYQRPVSEWPEATRDAQTRDAIARPDTTGAADTAGGTAADLAPWPHAVAAPLSPQAALGQRLFNDPILSASGQISCQSCHHPELGWGDGLSRSVGHNRTQGIRNAPPLYNVVHRDALGWDGATQRLATQLRKAMTHPAEMGVQAPDDILQRLAGNTGYRHAFTAVYGDTPIAQSHLDDALIAFLGTLETPTTLDRFLAGDSRRLSDQQLWGMHLFRTKARCINCHTGALLSDQGFHNLGLASFLQPSQDLGRYQESGKPEDAGRFRTPSLRHVAQTAPYMHNGIFRDLRSVVRFYTQGGGETRVRNDQEAAHPLYAFVATKSASLEPVPLSDAEIDALTAFLQAL